MSTLVYRLIGTLISPPRRDERGLSQSTENAILLAGAAAIAITVVAIVTGLVQARIGALR